MTDAPRERLHHLDALRAFAMLLGVALHASLSFTDMEWAVKDVRASGAPGLAVAAIHGFRMQLFFLLAGYFAMALLRHRGARGFVANRARRIALPLALACATIVPASWAVTWWVSDGRATQAIRELLAPLPWVPWLMAFPLLGHLWFLWHLCWMLAALLAVHALARRVPWLRPPAVLVRTPLCLLWLVPVTAVLAAPMGMWGTRPSFGADTSAGVLPMPHVLLYYGAFFAFGALASGVPGAIAGMVRGWWAWLAVAVVVFLPAAVLGGLAPEAERLFPDPGTRRMAMLLGGATYAWCMTLGSIGAAGALLHRERAWRRWLADASYWVYLVHLPVVVLLQWAVSEVQAPALAKFAAVLAATMAVTLATYAWAVRPTWIGRMLNGTRT